jgi:D-alanine-D-alanine ligase
VLLFRTLLRVGLIYERKSDFPFGPSDLPILNSELFSEFEEDALLSALRDAGHLVVRIGDRASFQRDRARWLEQCDLIFNLSAGYRGLERKAEVPADLDEAGIPYVGSPAEVQRWARHKVEAKRRVAAAGVETPKMVQWRGPADDAALGELPYPVIVKPVAESSSIGIEVEGSVVSTPTAARQRAVWIVETFRQPALVEQFIHGVEVEVPLLGTPALEVLGSRSLEIAGALVTGELFLSSDLVYIDGYEYVPVPSHVDRERVEAAAWQSAAALELRDYGRIDFRVAADGTPYFIDAAATPQITPHSSFFALARERGQSYPEMLDEIVRVAWRRVQASAQSSQNSMSQKYQGMR